MFHLIDSHCHPQLAAYDHDRDVLIRRTLGQGIGMIAIGTNYATSLSALALAARYDGLWATIGVHPGHVFKPHHDPDEIKEAPVEEVFNEARFEEMSAAKRCVGVGEVGLDYYRLDGDVEENKRRQRNNFAGHIRFAMKKDLPLVMHVRDKGDGLAYREVYKMVEDIGGGKARGVMHCFGGSADDAREAVRLGLSIGIGGIVTFPARKNESENSLWGVVRETPLDRILVETDAPYLAPVPLRGTRNEPANVATIAEKIAVIRGETLENIAEITTANIAKLFNLAEALKP